MEMLVKQLVKQMPLRYTSGIRAGKIMGLRDRARSVSIIRYADEFVILHENKNVIIKCKQAISSWLLEIGLELSIEKTRISHTLGGSEADLIDPNFSETPGFNLLGFTVRQFQRKYRGVNGIDTIIIPSKQKCEKHLKGLKTILTSCREMSQGDLILKLNPIIAGWASYFGNSDASSEGILKKMDFLLYLKLRRWAKRKTKTAHAGLNKYWKRVGNRKFVFTTEIDGQNMYLHQYTDFSRSLRNEYVKVRGESSPFDGKDTYWAKTNLIE
jgi:RNA-directed DNA polymerase